MRRPISSEPASDFEPTAVLPILDFDTELGVPPSQSSTTRATLSPSVLMDLKRFAEQPESADLLVVVAAALRHGRPLRVRIDLDGQNLPLILDPQRQLFRCAMDLCGLSDQAMRRVKLLSVGEGPEASDEEVGLRNGLLRPLAWHVAMRGDRAELLPELKGAVRCRVTRGVSIGGVQLDGALKRIIERMKYAPVSLDELVVGSPLGAAMVQRLWNALYLQSGLMVTRTYPQ